MFDGSPVKILSSGGGSAALIHRHKPQCLLSLCKRPVFLGFWCSVHQLERETVGPVNVYCQSGWPRWVCCVMGDTFFGDAFRPPTERGLWFSTPRQSQHTCCWVLWALFLHIVHNPVCPCYMNCCRSWMASVLFCQGQPVSNGQCRRKGKMIPPHVSDWWVLAQHI